MLHMIRRYKVRKERPASFQIYVLAVNIMKLEYDGYPTTPHNTDTLPHLQPVGATIGGDGKVLYA